MSKVILLATDPELFTRNVSSKLISSVAGLLGADKYNKKVVTDDIRIQEDNVLVEFDTNPHGDFDGFNANIQRGIDLCQEAVAEVGHEVILGVSSHIFTPEELLSFHKDAFVFGCEPDYNALTGMRNPKPAAADPGLRTAGGHIHIGVSGVVPVTSELQKVMGVMCDYYLGLPALLQNWGREDLVPMCPRKYWHMIDVFSIPGDVPIDEEIQQWNSVLGFKFFLEDITYLQESLSDEKAELLIERLAQFCTDNNIPPRL